MFVYIHTKFLLLCSILIPIIRARECFIWFLTLTFGLVERPRGTREPDRSKSAAQEKSGPTTDENRKLRVSP